ncbi:MAG: 23S rRNA (adenine(2030)-N(6))-methyltransferase RlmJ [Rickettsia endosymbiont of Haemaphysalis japonica]
MNYRHIYHAGNFADIVKHLVLISILEQLKKKEKPFAVLDAFAGLGLYDLNSEAASKTLESDTGINKLLQATDPIPQLLQTFLNIINIAGKSHYPGSPFIIKQLLRPNDRLMACELHPSDYLSLKKLLPNDTHNIDAYNAIKALLPFKENRGLILLDPPFEVKNEFQKLLEALKKIKLRVLNNTVLIWYPIKDLSLVCDFYYNYKNIGFKETMIIEYELLNSDKNMVKCGLILINPPNIRGELEKLTEYLSGTLNLKFIYIYL